MQFELRIHGIEDLHSLAQSKATIISTGDESCLHRLPSEEEIKTWADWILSRNLRMRVVFPRIEEKYMEYTCRYTEKLLQQYPETALTLNDLGHIYNLKGLLRDHGFTVGRLLSTSMENWAWGEKVLDEEEEWVKETVLQNNMNNALKISFFRDLGAEYMETNLLTSQEKSFSAIQQKGFKVLAHYNYLYLSICRYCPLKRFVREKPPGCVKECRAYYLMKLSETNDFYEKVHGIYPDLVVSGKGIYRKNPRELKEYSLDHIDIISIDAHYLKHHQVPGWD